MTPREQRRLLQRHEAESALARAARLLAHADTAHNRRAYEKARADLAWIDSTA